MQSCPFLFSMGMGQGDMQRIGSDIPIDFEVFFCVRKKGTPETIPEYP